MISKREKRLIKQQQKIEEQQEKIIRTRNILLVDKEPRQNALPQNEKKKPHLPPHLERQFEKQQKNVPPANLNSSRFASHVTWCISKADRSDHWSWGESRGWTESEWNAEIEPKFIDFSKLTWREIDSHSSESGHKMHHGHELTELHDEAQERWLLDLELDEFVDDIFRFRLGATQRAWGYIVQSHFFMIWYERKHIIYKVEKRS